MQTSQIDQILDKFRKLTTAEKLALLNAMIDECISVSDEFTEDEIAEVKLAAEEVAKGDWVDFDEFRRIQNI